jgi:SAM-dependent methyltransferase
MLHRRAASLKVSITATCEDLEQDYRIEPESYDLIAVCYYLQRNLFEPAKRGVVPGGVFLAIVHITEQDEEPTKSRLRPGELASFYKGWEILHLYEGKPNDPAHKRSVAEIVARRPAA